MKSRAAAWLALSILAAIGSDAADARAKGAGMIVERAIVRFSAPETGGVASPHFIYERVLAFEARLESLGDPDRDSAGLPYRERHVTAALERHIAETLLAGLHIDPEPTQVELERQIQSAERRLVERATGPEAFASATRAEGMGPRDVFEILRRQARASLYLDRMVAPMLDPSDAELQALYRTRRTPFGALPFEEVRPGLRRWYVAQRLSGALQSFYQNARSRLNLTLLAPLPGSEHAE